MAENNRKASGAVEQIIDNMTSDMQNADGQYIQLGFTPSPTTTESWNMQSKLPYIPPYINVMHNQESNMFAPVGQFGQVPYNYVQQPPLFSSDPYEKYNQNEHNQHCFDVYQNKPDMNMFEPNYKLFMPSNLNNLNMNEHNYVHNHQENSMLSNNNPQCSMNHTPLLENLTGNWTPNSNGTYSPFGTAASLKPSLFESTPNCFNNIVHQVLDEPNSPLEFCDRSNDDIHFPFSRDNKKPRMVAEVKPMRPSYSDVLLKSAPQTAIKSNRNEIKDNKLKKESKKNLKNDKTQKINNSLNRNPNNDSKDIISDKNTQPLKSNDKANKENKTSQLNRKWSSLNNVTEIFPDTKSDSENNKSRKYEDTINKTSKNQKKFSKTTSDYVESDSISHKVENFTITKTAIKKNKSVGRARYNDSFGNNEKPPGKRTQRNRKRENNIPLSFTRQKIKAYLHGWWKIFIYIILWLIHLISDICSLSVHLSRDMICTMWSWLNVHSNLFVDNATIILKRVHFITWLWDKIKRKNETDDSNRTFKHAGLQNNINMPTTGEEAMKRLLACKGKDPYSILGVTPGCTDEDIKKYYKRQAVLVHPDKNQQPGAEEAFKILVHAFNMIGEPERRQAYDRGVAESAQVEQAWSELNELIAQLQQKVEASANTIRCSACGSRHKRIKIGRPNYAARNCSQCKIHHSAREGDIWAEASCFGFLWHYYACMDGGVYDITEWAGCQKDSLKHLRPDSHHVQYRIALGKQNGGPSKRYNSTPRSERSPDLENLLSSLYGQSDNFQNTRRKNKKNK